MPTVFKTSPDSVLPTGLVLYAVLRMTDEQVNVDALLRAARDGALPGLAVALIPGLIRAAGSRPACPLPWKDWTELLYVS